MAPPGSFNAAHVALNRGKRSLVLDLRSPGAADVLRAAWSGGPTWWSSPTGPASSTASAWATRP